jgi:hypothetical protein
VQARLVRASTARRTIAWVHFLAGDYIPSDPLGLDKQHLPVAVEFADGAETADLIGAPLREGLWRIVIAEPTSLPWETRIHATAGEVTQLASITLVPASGELRLRVQGTNGEPLDRAAVNFWSSDPIEGKDSGLYRFWLGSGMRGEAGEFVLAPLPPFASRIKADIACRGFADQSIVVSTHHSPLTVQLQPVDDGGSISGIVLDADGHPVEAAVVVVRGCSIGTMSDANGRFHLGSVRRSVSLEVCVGRTGFRANSFQAQSDLHSLRIVLERE